MLHTLATKKKAAAAVATGRGPPTAACIPAEEMALEQNHACPIIEGIEGGKSSEVALPRGMQSCVLMLGLIVLHSIK